MDQKRPVPLLSILFGLGLALGQGPAGVAPAGPPGEPPTRVMESGGALFAEHCARCHGPEGEGAVGPALTDEARVSVESEVITQVLRGSMYMPPFGRVLDDEQVAAVVTYVRNSFGNAYGTTTGGEVAERR